MNYDDFTLLICVIGTFTPAVVEMCRRGLIRECFNGFMNHKDLGVNDETLKLRYFEGSLVAGR